MSKTEARGETPLEAAAGFRWNGEQWERYNLGISLSSGTFAVLNEAIDSWHEQEIEKRVREARIEELESIDAANRDNGINFYFLDLKDENNGWRTMRQYIPERIKELEALSPDKETE